MHSKRYVVALVLSINTGLSGCAVKYYPCGEYGTAADKRLPEEVHVILKKEGFEQVKLYGPSLCNSELSWLVLPESVDVNTVRPPGFEAYAVLSKRDGIARIVQGR
jgi:hypothetical protein